MGDNEIQTKVDREKTILAVDDSAYITHLVGSTLRQAGYDVIEARNGVDGLEKLKSQPVHLIITDHNMPKMDGLTMVKKVRSMPNYQSVPILMLTTEGSPKLLAQGKAAGMNGWIVKPFKAEKLVWIVDTVIHNTKHRKKVRAAQNSP